MADWNEFDRWLDSVLPYGALVALIGRVADVAMSWPFRSWYWGDAIAIDGLLEAWSITSGAERSFVVSEVTQWCETSPRSFDDVLAPGGAIGDLVRGGLVPDAALKKFLDAATASSSGRPDALPFLEPARPLFRSGFCIDALYHLPPALMRASSCPDAIHLQLEAVRMARRGLQLLKCDSGWAQWYDFPRRSNNGIAWSRGVGWALLGTLDLLASSNAKLDVDLMLSSAAMLDLLSHTQGSSGNWPAVLGVGDCPEESSTAAFYVASALHPLAANSNLPNDVSCLKAATIALLESISPAGTVQGVSADVLPSWDLSNYRKFHTEPSPWGQGAALRALAALGKHGRPDLYGNSAANVTDRPRDS